MSGLADGDAGVMKAMEMSVDWLSAVREGTFLIFGVDTYMEADTLEWLERDRRVARKGVE